MRLTALAAGAVLLTLGRSLIFPTVAPATPTPSAQIRSGELRQLLDSGVEVLVIDVRPPLLYRMGHIPGAINLPTTLWDTQEVTELLDGRAGGATRLIVYCSDENCEDSARVAEKIRMAGRAAAVLQGGWNAWREGRP